MAEQTIIRYMWTTASTFYVFHELDDAYNVPDTTGLVSDECYRLIKVPAIGGREDGVKTQWLLDGGTWGKEDGKEYHAQVWCTEDDGCWPTLEAASKAIFQRALDHLSWSLSVMCDLIDDGSECKADFNKTSTYLTDGKSYGETIAYLTARMTRYFACHQELITNILLQHRRLWLQQQGDVK